MYQYKSKEKQESIPELIGGLIGSVLVLAVYLAVPVLFICAAVKILSA